LDEEKEFVKEITAKSKDFSQWYIDVIRKAELADYSPIKGCMVIRPYGFALWENVQSGLDRRIKETGHKNAYFPLFIPESFLKKEAEHVQGFAPQVAWVTQGGDEGLEERLAVRPTSEAIICSMYSKWIKSYRDLPVLINQWANVVRWEKVTRLFLRTTEFLWQEGHTAHRTAEEAEEEALKMLNVYVDFLKEDLAIPTLKGIKSEREKFPGAVCTYTFEALMSDGKALQAGTSHNLGQHFAKAFNIKYLDVDNTEKYVWQTSWGVTTRLIGALIMTHGDDRGLAFPPKVAPIQVVIVPIWGDERDKVIEKVEGVGQKLEGLRVEIDLREEYTPGWKYNDWEMRGVPLRVEIGPKDVKNKQVVLVRRDTGEKLSIPEEEVRERIKILLGEIQKNMYEKSQAFLRENTSSVQTFEEFTQVMEDKRGFVRAYWCGDGVCEEGIQEKTTATLRCIPLEETKIEGKLCVYCGREAKHLAYFAKAY